MQEVYTWYLNNQPTPHLSKSEVMLLSTGNPMGPVIIALVFIGGSNPRWVTETHLLGMTVDHKLTWELHVRDIKKSFVTKLD